MFYPVHETADAFIGIDSLLEPYRHDIEERISRLDSVLAQMNGSAVSCSGMYKYFGFHRSDGGWTFREWLPGADEVFLTGDFNGWDRTSDPLYQVGEDVWEIILPAGTLYDGCHVKLWVKNNGECFERIPAYMNYVLPDPDTHIMCGVIYDKPGFRWTDSGFTPCDDCPLIYEAHVGMAQEYEGIGTYREFADSILPRIAEDGYNTVQLMAIAEHPYYASFGYQVTSFFAPSSRFGTPDDLKYLINKAHSLGLRVLLDVIHSHACPNVGEGLYCQDGETDSYFLKGDRGWHPAWGTRLFDYGKPEVIRFLLSNLAYWMNEFHFDGFRFDGVTSMIFENHGLGTSFTSYNQYYSPNTNIDALVYLTLANLTIHAINKKALTVAEDMSGTPGMCLPVKTGGIGFDYRLAMGIPDYYVKLLKEYRYNSWNMGRLWFELTSSRKGEKRISYAESHDQALVGDKTLIFRMADAEMYTGMSKDYHSLSLDNAVSLHKLIRMLTFAASGDGYLNFMGNEFGHPEWIDFPREGNGWSCRYARRQWSLADNRDLKYYYLGAFDKAMLALEYKYHFMHSETHCLQTDETNQTVSFERGGLIFVFNFHTVNSYTDFFVRTDITGNGKYKTVFSSDSKEFLGFGRTDMKYEYISESFPKAGNGFCYYIPSCSVSVLERIQ